MTTNRITTEASTVAIRQTIKLASNLIRRGQRGAYRIDNSADHTEPMYTLFNWGDAWGLALEEWADRTVQRLGVPGEMLEHAAYAD
jgi:hypothetical protein